jgi:tetratricopeptide (TPR) repeat protein
MKKSIKKNTEDSLQVLKNLRKAAQKKPNNLQVHEDLAVGLLNSFLYEDGQETILQELHSIIKRFPKANLLYERAYLAWIDKQDNKMMKYLADWLLELDDSKGCPLTPDYFYWVLIFPFETDFPDNFFKALSEAVSIRWNNSAASIMLTSLLKEQPLDRIDGLVLALQKDPSFWYTSVVCGFTYTGIGNWRAAKGYYIRALKSETAASLPINHFLLAWCLGKIKDYKNEEYEYSVCLEIDPEYPFARNNLGWSLVKQLRYEEAVTVFKECLRQKSDGKYPLRNLARALDRLGSYEEAIEVLKGDTYNGTITKTAKNHISTIRDKIKNKKLTVKADKSINKPLEEEDIFEDNEIADSDIQEEEEQPPIQAVPSTTRALNSIKTEKTLEALIEEMVLRDSHAFGRNVRIYEDDNGRYGRQLVIPGIGRIDLLLEDTLTGELIVVELKRDNSEDEVVGQLCRYMGWVNENLSKQKIKVSGIVCVHRSTEKLKMAVSAIPSVSLVEHNLSFNFI